MAKQRYCEECGVPRLLYRELTWRTNGTIIETKDPEHRMLFSESENLDGLFDEIEKIIGIPIEKFVIESKRRVAKDYLEKMIPSFVLRLLYTFRPGLIVDRMTLICEAHGYGKIQSSEVCKHTERGAYQATVIDHPYSILCYRGDNLGGMEASTRRDCTSRVTEVGDDKYLLELWAGNHPPELKERMKVREYPVEEGNIEFKRCSRCDTPLAVAAYDFNLDDGTIINPENGTRMAIFGPVGLEAVFTALEEELGDMIPETVIEAQKRYTREHFRVEDWVAGEEHLRRMIAMRGYGILKSYEADLEHFAATIHNPVVIPLIVGMAKGIFEKAMKIDSSVHEWSISEDGELRVNIRKE
ncbi:MAG: hypothetical protein JXA49_09835 [Actinobacteria bacterium]|nr:hypothetical protein [Actinomycetota bacterium]